LEHFLGDIDDSQNSLLGGSEEELFHPKNLPIQQKFRSKGHDKMDIYQILDNNNINVLETKTLQVKKEASIHKKDSKSKIQNMTQTQRLNKSCHSDHIFSTLNDRESNENVNLEDVKIKDKLFIASEHINDSLTLSEREALVYAAMHGLKQNKFRSHVKLEDLLAILPDQEMNASIDCVLFDSKVREKNPSPNKLKTTLKALTLHGVKENISEINESLKEEKNTRGRADKLICEGENFCKKRICFQKDSYEDVKNLSLRLDNGIYKEKSNYDEGMESFENEEVLDSYLKNKGLKETNQEGWEINNEGQYLPQTEDTKHGDRMEEIELMKRLQSLKIIKDVQSLKSNKSKKSLKKKFCFGFCGGLSK